jgi:NAD(P)-dependent dehydrogenase (short-subunit alcohol dehydrogenase family)
LGRVEGKVTIVTGAASGIGWSTCLLLAREGSKVAVTHIHDDTGEELVSEIKRSGGVAEYWHMSVSNEKEVAQVFADIYKKFGKIDVLVNNAGTYGSQKTTHETDEEEWDKVINANLKGVFFCTKHVIPYMKKDGGGSIINISSILGLVGTINDSPYHASKGGVRLLTKTDAISYGKDKIRVNSVHPGYIRTPMFERVGALFPGGIKAFNKYVASLHPIGNCGEPSDIAYGILYLASDESKFVTGSELVIDGGYTAQ